MRVCRLDVPLADLVTADEYDTLCDGFGVDGQRPGHCSWDILSGCKILDQRRANYRRRGADVAQVHLAQLGHHLPQRVGATRAGVYQTVPPVLGNSRIRMVEQWSCQLITVDRADNVPGFSWGAGGATRTS
jgi:hypothetical protein